MLLVDTCCPRQHFSCFSDTGKGWSPDCLAFKKNNIPFDTESKILFLTVTFITDNFLPTTY